MSFRAVQVLLAIAFLCRTSTGTQEANTRWTYKDTKSSVTKLLPDSIQINFELEGNEITLNLIKKIKKTIKPPLIMTQLEGQRSVWKPHEEESLGIYKDPSNGASATVTTKKTDETIETLYMVTFTHDNKSFSLEPSAVFDDYFSPGKTEGASTEDDNDDNKSSSDKNSNNNNNRSSNEKNNNKGSNEKNNNTSNMIPNMILLDGRLYSIVETSTTKSQHNLDEDRIRDRIIEARMRKRSIPSSAEKRLMTVEIFTFIDYAIFNKFFKESKAKSRIEKKEDALRSIFFVFSHYMEGVRNNYEDIDLEGVKFTIKWVGALIAQSPTDVPFFESLKLDPDTIDASVILGKLKDWNDMAKRNELIKLPNYDFLLALTRHNMIQDDRIYYGRAYVGKVCTSYGVGVVRLSDFSHTVRLISHELGHSLGIQHDGERNDCSSSDQFIMRTGVIHHSKDTFYNSYLFSNCSLSHLNDTVTRLDREGNCLTNGGGRHFKAGRERSISLHLFPGQLYDLDEQCKMAYGPKSFYCGGAKNDQEMCQTIKCHNGDKCESNYLLNAMDGTSCSNGSWCRRGKCTPDSRAPRAPRLCTNGDKRFDPTNLDICEQKVRKNSSLCNIEKFQNYCCASCAGKRILSRGCQDTLDECSNLEPKDCYNKYYATTCCKTCKALVQNPSVETCLYGDKGFGCTDLVPEVCHLSTQFCCQTCASYLSPRDSAKIPNTGSVFSSTSSFTNSCTGQDVKGSLKYISVWGVLKVMNCSQLVENDSSLCYDARVQKYCCASCSSVEMVKDYCINGDREDSFLYLSKRFTCRQLVAYNPRLCERNNIKVQCCESCGRFTIEPSSN